jgi:tetratricopeptide (TPR) repeat protein
MTSISQEPVHSGAAITIAISGAEEEEGNNFFLEAEKNERRGDLNDALTYFGKAAFEYNTSGKFNRYGAALLRLSNVHLLMEHYIEAEQVVLNVALKNYVRIKSRAGQMESYNQLGRICLAANKLTESLWFYTQQGILAQQLKNNSSYIDTVLGIAKVKIKKKEYRLAVKDINRAELLSRNNKFGQFKAEIREARGIIKEREHIKK